MKAHTVLIVSGLLMLAVALNAQNGNNTLAKEVILPPDSLTKEALLDSITRQTGIHFSYDPELLESGKKVKPNLTDPTVYSVVSYLVDPEKLGFHALDNQVVLFPVKATYKKEKTRFKVIRGRVVGQKRDEPIPFCSIAIVGKALGTLSNNEGIFAIKIPEKYWEDTLRFSCLGFAHFDLPIDSDPDIDYTIQLKTNVYKIRSIDVNYYKPDEVLERFWEHVDRNYEKEYSLFTTYYREIVMENGNFTDVSEAILHVLKAPYEDEIREDLVRFLKGRKSSNVKPFDEIRFRLKGGPYYITRLDIVKNHESFLSNEFRQLYSYRFEKGILLNGRETALISFSPIYNLKELLYEGTLYFDTETWALARVEFRFTKEGIKEARRMLIEKEPRDHKAIPTELTFLVQYRMIEGKWYFNLARSMINIKLNNRDKKERTNFQGISEILTTNIEKGDLQHFSRKDIFKPNEFFTEKITGFDKDFWDDYNVIEPEDELELALKRFNDHDMIIIKK